MDNLKMDKFSDDKARLLDIAKSIDEIQETIAGMKFEDFIRETDIRDDVAYMLQEIGGAARLLSFEFKETYGDIDWDVLTNLQFATYDQEIEIDPNAIWYVIENDLSLIKDQVLGITTVLEDKESDNFFYF
ncbi:MAG TPA: HepT-like ribonuclease domain-containing protein [Cytophagaceae bacterium]|nr:HepT-like ribonuclease domain-containing protein [Cytophagaceae bacterium]